MQLTYNNRHSWLATIWQALHSHRENCIPEGDEQFDNQWSDITTAMAWIAESIGASDYE